MPNSPTTQKKEEMSQLQEREWLGGSSAKYFHWKQEEAIANKSKNKNINHLEEVNKVLQAMEPLSPHNPVSGIVRVTDLRIFRNQIQARMVILNF